jgi:hypothetical protein
MAAGDEHAVPEISADRVQRLVDGVSCRTLAVLGPEDYEHTVASLKATRSCGGQIREERESLRLKRHRRRLVASDRDPDLRGAEGSKLDLTLAGHGATAYR